MWNSTLNPHRCTKNSCWLWFGLLSLFLLCWSWLVSTRSHQTDLVAVICVFCWKELFGCIWDWVLRIFCATIVVTFFSEIFLSMPLVDVCLKLNYVNLYVPHVVYLFISILHTSSIMDHTHNTHRDHQKSINITIIIKFWPQPIHHPHSRSY